MFDRFFNFQENPFSLTPDPRFFYANPMYREAYDRMYEILREHRGYMALTGETGAGKTTLLKTLMNNMDADCRCVYFEYSNLTFADFLALACNKLGLETEGGQSAATLKSFLVEQSRKGITIALFIDEAQNIPVATLVEILGFTDALGEEDNLIQIVLSGQPQLETHLELPQLLPLKQRLSLHYRLTPLPGKEVGNFIHHRLSIAGNRNADIMTGGAIHQVAQHAQGRPRLINMLCNRALIAAYATSQKRVSAAVMEDAIKDLREEQGDLLKILGKAPGTPPETGAAEPVHNGPGKAQRGQPAGLPRKENARKQEKRVEPSPSERIKTVHKALHPHAEKGAGWTSEQPAGLPEKRDAGGRAQRFKNPLLTGITTVRTALHPGLAKLSGWVHKQWVGAAEKRGAGGGEQRFKRSLLAGITTVRKVLHPGIVKLSGWIHDLRLGLAGTRGAWEGVRWFKRSLLAGITTARKVLHPSLQRLSGWIHEHPVGMGKGAAIVALAWLLLYPALEQKPDEGEPAVTGTPATETAMIPGEQSVSLSDPPATTFHADVGRGEAVPLKPPPTAPESASPAPTQKTMRTFYASNQSGKVELIETSAFEVISEQTPDTAEEAHAGRGLSVSGSASTPAAGIPDAEVRTAVDADTRRQELERKLLASEERLTRVEAELAKTRGELDRARRTIQEHETQVDAYISGIGSVPERVDELTPKPVSFPEHPAQLNLTPHKPAGQLAQPRLQVQEGLNTEPQQAVTPDSRIDRLLARGDELLQVKYLTTPAGNNAFEVFRQVLEIAPGNPAALDGIERIKQQYLTWGARAQEKRDWLNAGNYYQKALTVDPSDQSVAASLREVRVKASRSDRTASPDTVAQSKEREDARERLAQQGVPVTPKALLINAERGDVEMVRSLLAAGIPPNVRLSGGWTALMSAATHGRLSVVRTLLTQGADVNMKNDDGRTALTAAAWNGHTEVVKELLARGAKVNEQNDEGWTALMYAAWNGHRPVVEALLEGEAKTDVKDNNDWTALTAASSEGHIEIVRILEMADGL